MFSFGKIWSIAAIAASVWQLTWATSLSWATPPVKTLYFSQLEKGVLAEMNRARTNPRAYSMSLRQWRQKFRGTKARLAPGFFLQTKEGVSAVDEAIRVLEKTHPGSQLRMSVGLTRAARDHVLDQGRHGTIGHAGSNKSTPFDRINRYGRWGKTAGENISYGADTAVAVVRDLIVDDGIPDRGHRVNIFRREYRLAGVACGHHKTYRVMCVISYAATYQEKK
jgi:uncharacterized protein YkwD